MIQTPQPDPGSPLAGDAHQLLQRIIEGVQERGNHGVLIVSRLKSDETQLGMAFTFLGLGETPTSAEDAERLERSVGRSIIADCRRSTGEQVD